MELQSQRGAVLSLDQIQALRSSNQYTEGPVPVRGPVQGPAAPHMAPHMAPRQHHKHERTHEVVLVNINNNYEHRPAGQNHPGGVGAAAGGGSRAPTLSRSTSTGSAGSSGSNSSASSERGLLARSPPGRPAAGRPTQHRPERPVRTQPKAKASSQPRLLQPPPEAPLKPPGKGKRDYPGSAHQFICERCSRCKCGECSAPRSLPARLACGGHCLCSADSVLEHGTCMCLVKGVFYHCSNDDQGDSCSDQPCSLSRPHCCSRFLCMGLMSVLFPCLLCYPPVRFCLKAGQRCYDRVHRPGCRCKNSNTVYCKLEAPPPHTPEKPS